MGFAVFRGTMAVDLRCALGMNTAGSTVAAATLALVLAVPVSKPVAPRLALGVQREGRALHLFWDGHSPAIQGSNHVTLHIIDGTHHTQLALNYTELSAGRLVYWPETDRVTFRLEGAAAGEVTVGAIPLSDVPVKTAVQSDNSMERKPSPFRSPKARLTVQDLASQAAPDLTPASNVPPAPVQPAPRPGTSFFGRLARKIPVLRRLRKPAHRPAEDPD